MTGLHDQVTETRLLTLHPLIRQEAIERYLFLQNERNIIARCVYAKRTNAEQDLLYSFGRTRPGKIVTWARGGESFHNYALAHDFCLLHADKSISWSTSEDLNKDQKTDWKEVADAFIEKGWEWGGNWSKAKRDLPHLQKTFGFTISDLQNLAKKSHFDEFGYLILK